MHTHIVAYNFRAHTDEELPESLRLIMIKKRTCPGLEYYCSREGTCLAHSQPHLDPQHTMWSPKPCRG